ncbi:hypothetical protein [Flavobacterium sedimenticola]|uniref:Uncharacterized protein n=1 Tax=Flavobacterium sedimenticola TaxID=3043286 RepID=A0ABT6XQE5_9FLAO|nr:hypothetical protein [Flavobacterium sedimenticola]MDI9257281.1 hypothetical protein [Flavobacterium sedimenticola]
MEKIIDYKVKDFFRITDLSVIQEYTSILEHLNPLNEIPNPKYKWYHKWFKKHPKTLQIKDIRSLSFGKVNEIKMNLLEASDKSIFDTIKMLVDVEDYHILNFTITTFYGIISKIRKEIIEIKNAENNELVDEYEDEFLAVVNAKQRLEKFGVINDLDLLSKEDVLKWKEIEELPYMVVFTKLRLEKEKNKIKREVAELQKKKQSKK